MISTASLTEKPPLPDWQRIELVLLDMDGTLLDLHFDNHFWVEHIPASYARLHGYSLAHSRQLLEPRFTALRGQLDWYCVEFWSRELGMDVLAMKQAMRGGIRILPGVEACLQALKASGRRLWLLTNAHTQVMQLKLEHTGIGQYFEHCISTHQLGHPKEDALLWQTLDQHYPFDATRALMVDDGADILRMARACGIGQVLQLLWPDSQQPVNTACELPAVPRLADLPLRL